MKAAQIVAPRAVRVVDVPEPEIADAPEGSIKVRIDLACLCGSDIPLFSYDLTRPRLAADGTPRRRAAQFLDYGHRDPYPLRVGQAVHECVGTVVASTSSAHREGDLVLAVPYRQDGLCEYLCLTADRAIPLPRNGMAAERLLMSQPLGTVLWACQRLGGLLNMDVVVFGQGPMGLLISHVLSNLGARTVIGMDRLDYRLEAARRMRATHTVNVDREDPAEAVKAITEGRMADLVFEAVGHQTATLTACMGLLRRRGTLVAFGVPDEEVYDDFAFSAFFRKNLALIGSVGPDFQPNYPLARDMIVQGRVDVSPLVTHRLPFQQVQRAYELFTDRRDGAIKVVIDYASLH